MRGMCCGGAQCERPVAGGANRHASGCKKMEYIANTARDLLLRQKLQELYEYAAPFARSGNVEAAVELAGALKLLGRQEESANWLALAEEAHFRGLTALWSAYSMMSLGPEDMQMRDKKAHLFQWFLAESGNVSACRALMYNYLQGRNGYPVDIEKSKYWRARAEALGVRGESDSGSTPESE